VPDRVVSANVLGNEQTFRVSQNGDPFIEFPVLLHLCPTTCRPHAPSKNSHPLWRSSIGSATCRRPLFAITNRSACSCRLTPVVSRHDVEEQRMSLRNECAPSLEVERCFPGEIFQSCRMQLHNQGKEEVTRSAVTASRSLEKSQPFCRTRIQGIKHPSYIAGLLTPQEKPMRGSRATPMVWFKR